MRKRGWGTRRWFGGGGGGNRMLDSLRDVRGVGLREIRELENVEELPENMAAGAARWEGNRPIALLASRRDGLDLLGWARIVARRAAGDRSLREVLIAAPHFSQRTREAATRAGEIGPSVHLLALPALAEGTEVFELESHPAPAKPSLIGGSTSLLARLLRVLEGAAAVSGVGGIRPAGVDFLVYARGERVARVAVEGDGAAVAIALPEKRVVAVSEANFTRVAAELHDWLVRLAQDLRLQEGAAARRDALVEQCADEAHAGVTAHSVPWNSDGSDPIDWVGVVIDGRPVVGAIRATLDVRDVPALVAGWHLLDLEREIWTPGAVGLPRLFISSQGIASEARELLESLAGPIGAVPVPAAPARVRSDDQRRDEFARDDFARKEFARDEAPRDSRAARDERPPRDEVAADDSNGAAREEDIQSERRGRRRGRRRRRGGGRDFRDADAPVVEGEPTELAAFDGESDESAEAPAEPSWRERERGNQGRDRDRDRGRDRDREPERDRARLASTDADVDRDAEIEPESSGDPADSPAGEETAGRRRGRRGRRRRGGRRDSSEPRTQDGGVEAASGSGEDGEAAEADGAAGEGGDFDAPELAAEAHDGDSAHAEALEDEHVANEIEATLAEGEEAHEQEPAAEPVEVEPPRIRRQRAAILVRDEPDSILAALVLARDRRTIVSFRVAPQEGLMDFFKGPATDIAENVDVLVVGFSAQPRPKEVLDTAELFRGRLQWFDHHEWAIEDLVRLRATLGRDSIIIADSAASPLPAVNQVTERRSRFTDKLVDLSARRLSETDMQKWGNRVIALIKRMAQTPGEHRAEIMPVLAGKPTDLPSAPDVYYAETSWVEENDPRIVHFGEYQLAVARVPSNLDPGEVGRRLRLRTGARLSLATREGDDIVVLSCNDEKRPLNVSGLLDVVGGQQPWVTPKSGGDRIGRARIDGLPDHPERMEALIGEIVRHRSVLYG